MIHATGIVVSHEDGPFVLRVDDFRALPGELHVVLGCNGAGKTTLLRVLAGHLPPREGSVEVGGASVHGLNTRARARTITWVPVTGPLGFPMDVRAYVALGLFPVLGEEQPESPQDRARIHDALCAWDLGALATRDVDSLSSGERQRAALARAELQQTGSVLLDEPSAHLDPRRQAELWQRIRSRARERGIACVAATHDLHAASRFADRCLLLEHGRVLAHGPWHQLLSSGALRAAFGDHPCTVEPETAREGALS